MNRNIRKLLALSATATLLSAGLQADKIDLQAGLGYRQDSISWKHKGRQNVNPKIHSNLHFEDLEIFFLGVQAKTTFGCSNAYFKTAFDYGWVLDGRLREQLRINTQRRACEHARGAYSDCGEFLEASVHNNVRRHSFVWDLDFKLGYPLGGECDNFSVAPTLGFMLNREQLRVHGHTGLQEAFDIPFDGFDKFERKNHGSDFRFSAWGPYVGLDFLYNMQNSWTAYAEFEVHFGKIRRTRESLTEHAHLDHARRTREFWGPSIKVGANYLLFENLTIDASIYYSQYFSGCHNDKFTWSTVNLRLDAGYVF